MINFSTLFLSNRFVPFLKKQFIRGLIVFLFFLQVLSPEMGFQVCTVYQINLELKEFTTSGLMDDFRIS